MSQHRGNPPVRPGQYSDALCGWIVRSGRALGAAVVPLLAELRYLNRIGAGARSRSDRVAAVKRALSRHGEGFDRCC